MPIGFRVSRSGSWQAARGKYQGLQKGATGRIMLAVRRAALMLEAELKRGLQAGAPGGHPLKPLSPFTILQRRKNSSKPLLDTGALLGSIHSVMDDKNLSAFVGVKRGARGPGGEDLVNVATIHEFGTKPYAITVTPALRRFFLALSLKSGGRFKPLRADTTVIHHPGVPARPVFRPTLDALRSRLEREIKATFGG